MPSTLTAQQRDAYALVTDARLLDPEPHNWLMYRRTYDGWGYSPLDQITAQNVGTLVPIWSFSTGVREGHESPPIVNDGRMFVTTPQNQVFALDAATGELLWRYARELPDDLQQLHPTNRGVALYDDKVYIGTVDTHVVALAAASGEVVWEQAVENYAIGYYITMAPLVADGKVMIGTSGGERGIRGFVTALDAQTGAEAWKTYTIPAPGESGHDTWPGDSWLTGGAPVWVTGTYDPNLNLTYWGTGNPGPWIGDARPGDNLYTNSVLALDATTGELKGYHQYHHNGSWDWDEVDSPLLIDIERSGRTIPALVHPGRNGYLWLLERHADRIGFVDANPYVYQNVFTAIDPETGRPSYDPEHTPITGKRTLFCPSLSGGKNWPPAAYNPQTRLLYIPANENLCTDMEGLEVEYEPGRSFTGARQELMMREGDHIGELQAWNLDTGEKVWSQEFESQNWGPVLTTGGGLVFMGGTNDRYFRAFDASSGERLWQIRTNSGVTGVPSSYAVDGRQYIAVQSGWGVDAQRMQGGIDRFRGERTHIPQGGVIWVFALPD
ncbi:methanol/ethanol family PQQ-dependent dehydrogenase [bacterium AH-315-O15]|nr:methanol/ethanol family PQQ-dependent dehydrogenase [bacterium AH-315-O15]